MTTVDEIKNRIDILDLISDSVKLRRSGKNYLGFCPFHDNKRTPAFVVFPDSGTWRCFGQCNEGGDIFKYVMKKRAGILQKPCATWLKKRVLNCNPNLRNKKSRMNNTTATGNCWKKQSRFTSINYCKHLRGNMP